MTVDTRTQQQRYERIEELVAQTKALRAELLREIHDAFPERRGEQPQRGVLAEVSRRSGWSREQVAQIRDGKVTE